MTFKTTGLTLLHRKLATAAQIANRLSRNAMFLRGYAKGVRFRVLSRFKLKVKQIIS